MTVPADRSAACECSRCAEVVAVGAPACDFCGHVAPARKTAAQRLADVAALLGGLALVMALCALTARLTGV